MKKHRPNVVPRNTRVLLSFAIFASLAAALLALTVGYTYFPGRRGGFFLTGIPTIAFSCSLLFFGSAAALKFVDHYDKRPNEESYKSATRICIKAGFIFLAAAPLIELLLRLLAALGVSVPNYHGFGGEHLLPSPSRQQYLPYVSSILKYTKEVLIASGLLVGCGLLIAKYFGRILRRHAMVLAGFGVVGMSSLVLASTIQDYLEGKVSAGRKYHRTQIYAESDPARFNAVILTNLGLGSFMFSLGAVGLVAGTLPGRKAKRPRQRAI